MKAIAIAAYVAVILGLLVLTVAVTITVGAVQGIICFLLTTFAAFVSIDTFTL